MCDTFVAMPPVTADGSIIFGKNSDREPNEAQALEYHPARVYSAGEKLRCTYLTIPQVRQTYGILIGRPFWMWGAEMGANEKGVVIGNEAVWTRMPLMKKSGLTGMDLLRLALERADSAPQALETIVGLLADFGQGGICGFEDKRLAYHNSLIIADPAEGWVLETAGHLWAALKIRDFYAISNGLTIGEAIDECHPQLVKTARTKGWLKKGQTFNFSRCYADWFYTTFSASRRRHDRACELIQAAQGSFNVSSAIAALRDHQTDHYRPDSHLLGNRICAHAANRLARHATQSTGALVAHLKPEQQTYWATGTAAPCTSIFKPVWFGLNVLPDIGPSPDSTYNAQALWWQHEKLHRLVLPDFKTRLALFARQRDQMEEKWIKSADSMTAPQQWALTQEAFRRARQKTDEWSSRLGSAAVHRRNKWLYRRYWQIQNTKARIAV